MENLNEFVTMKTINKNYAINRLGEVKRIDSGRILKQCINYRGYLRVTLKSTTQKPSTHYVHKLIATYFIENPLNKPQINHIDGNKLNNNIYNLEWCTSKENHLHRVDVLNKGRGETHHGTNLTNEDVINIWNAKNMTHKKIGELYNCSSDVVSLIKNRRSWIHITKNL